jgi:hypothetical protein
MSSLLSQFRDYRKSLGIIENNGHSVIFEMNLIFLLKQHPCSHGEWT